MKTMPHFNDRPTEEQQAILARLHPCILESGIWVSPGAPTKTELQWMTETLGVETFRRGYARLMTAQMKASA